MKETNYIMQLEELKPNDPSSLLDELENSKIHKSDLIF